MNECTEDVANCADEAICVNTIGSYSCNCPEGYNGDGRQHGERCVGKLSHYIYDTHIFTTNSKPT